MNTNYKGEQKVRKERNPQKTKARIKEAVGYIIKNKGYVGLTVSNIAKAAGMAPGLITYYYESIDTLVEEYLHERDYWMTFAEKMKEAISKPTNDPEELLQSIIMADLEGFESDIVMRKFITWEVSEYTDLLRRESEAREAFSNLIFQKVGPYFENTDVDIRMVASLLIGGIYYVILHGEVNGSTFCGLDTTTDDGRALMRKTLQQMVSWAFEHAKKPS